jgi:K+-transporting ATPase ATPase C chain
MNQTPIFLPLVRNRTGKVRDQIRPAIVMLVLLTIITGLAYPLAVTGMAQVLFPHQANGSLIVKDGQVAGSELIGQPFGDPRYFWGRPSATAPFPYNAAASAGSNLGPSNPALAEAVKARIDALRAADPGNTRPVPVDLVTASASGLDPHISVAAALYQVPRVARERGLTEREVEALVRQFTAGRQLGVLGEPRVNVLNLNLALDAVQ